MSRLARWCWWAPPAALMWLGYSFWVAPYGQWAAEAAGMFRRLGK